MNSFSVLSLKPELLAAIDALGYQTMTAIQAQSLPFVLNNQDIIAQAKTGSGKTAVFALGVLSKIDVNQMFPQALILCPTRELADQVAKDIKQLGKFIGQVRTVTLCGGRPFRDQLGTIKHGAQIIIATPGRILDHLDKNTVSLSRLKILVLDEADRMLDMGFSEAIDHIISLTPQSRQTLLFSATYPDRIQEISASIQRNPVEVKVESQHSSQAIEQRFLSVKNAHERQRILLQLLSPEDSSTLIFCNTKLQCQELVEALRKQGFSALAIHGDLEQKEREEVMVLFANKSCSILVATDVASRGLDIKGIQKVINFELPRDPEVYIHRIGRTGRAGLSGKAFNLVGPSERRRLERLQDYQKQKFSLEEFHAPEPRLVPVKKPSLAAAMVTLKIAAGRKNKLCKGDILGALTGKSSKIEGKQVGNIDIFDFYSCVAIQPEVSQLALKTLSDGPIKGRSFKVKML